MMFDDFDLDEEALIWILPLGLAVLVVILMVLASHTATPRRHVPTRGNYTSQQLCQQNGGVWQVVTQSCKIN